MYDDLRRTLFRPLLGLVAALALSVVPVAQSAFSQGAVNPGQAVPNAQTQPQLVPGLALGDCADHSQAMARGAQPGLRRPPSSSVKTCEGGRIQMRVEAVRHFGHRLMDPVRVTVLLKFEPTTVVDLDSLRRGTITFNGQEFDLVSPLALAPGQLPVEVAGGRLQDGSVLLRIELLVQSSVPISVAPYLVFRLDLRYALGNIRDAGGQETTSLDWRVLSTPPVGLTMSPTAVSGDQFRDIAIEPVSQVRPWPTLWLLILGIFSILFMPGLLVVRWINRKRPGRIPSREEAAWRALDAAYASARQNGGFSKTHIRGVAHAVRAYFGIRSATLSEVMTRLQDHRHLSEIVEVLGACERVLFEGSAADNREMLALRRKLESIIPRQS
ncbi:MAG: hypothetical protein K2Y39_28815 [Candidatus Obscuribacterales bacterium]|nr:hypothetical protein [Candidatus Obscuribacterales bacterium]